MAEQSQALMSLATDLGDKMKEDVNQRRRTPENVAEIHELDAIGITNDIDMEECRIIGTQKGI